MSPACGIFYLFICFIFSMKICIASFMTCPASSRHVLFPLGMPCSLKACLVPWGRVYFWGENGEGSVIGDPLAILAELAAVLCADEAHGHEGDEDDGAHQDDHQDWLLLLLVHLEQVAAGNLDGWRSSLLNESKAE